MSKDLLIVRALSDDFQEELSKLQENHELMVMITPQPISHSRYGVSRFENAVQSIFEFLEREKAPYNFPTPENFWRIPAILKVEQIYRLSEERYVRNIATDFSVSLVG